MFTRLTTFPVKPNNQDKAREIAAKYEAVLHDRPGHLSTVMIVDGDVFMSISTWDTEEHAEAVMSTRNDAAGDLADILSGAPSTSITSTVVHDVR